MIFKICQQIIIIKNGYLFVLKDLFIYNIIMVYIYLLYFKHATRIQTSKEYLYMRKFKFCARTS